MGLFTEDKDITMGDFEISVRSGEIEIFHLHPYVPTQDLNLPTFTNNNLIQGPFSNGDAEDLRYHYFVLCGKDEKDTHHKCRLCEEEVPSAVEIYAAITRGKYGKS